MWSQEDEAYVANLLEFFDSDGNGEVDIYEFVALWEYIGGDKFMEAEKKEIHEWTAMCERYDGGGKGEAGGLTLTEMRQMVAENNVCAEGEQGMARLEKQVRTAAADILAAVYVLRQIGVSTVDGAGGEGGCAGLAAVRTRGAGAAEQRWGAGRRRGPAPRAAGARAGAGAGARKPDDHRRSLGCVPQRFQR